MLVLVSCFSSTADARTIGFAAIAATFAFITVLLHFFIIGMPVQFILQQLKLTDYFTNTLAAIVCTLFVTLLYAQIDWLDDNEETDVVPLDTHQLFQPSFLVFLSIFAFIGFALGSIGWLIRRPDLDTKSAKHTAWPIITKTRSAPASIK